MSLSSGKPITRTFKFPSLSNPSKVPYETVLYTDGTTSCNCPGWCKRNANNVRECKHTQMIVALQEAGLALSAPETIGSTKAVTVRATTVRVVARRRFDL